jgi:hypothetical protein
MPELTRQAAPPAKVAAPASTSAAPVPSTAAPPRAGATPGLLAVGFAQRATAGGLVRNPTFDDARDHLRTWFQRQKELGELLVDMKETGFGNFKIYSGEAYNQSDSVAMELFAAALALVPAAGAALKAWNALAKHAKFTAELTEKLAKVAEAAGTVIETPKKLAEPVTGVAGAVKKSAGAVESKAKAAFEASVITSLADLRIDNLVQRWAEEDEAVAALEAARYVPPNVDLLAIVRADLGPVPSASGLREAMQTAARSFENLLYLRFYVDSGRGYRWRRVNQIGDQYGSGIGGIPEGVLERLGSGGWEQRLPERVFRFSSPGKML